MKRLLSYLFIVFGLGILINFNLAKADNTVIIENLAKADNTDIIETSWSTKEGDIIFKNNGKCFWSIMGIEDILKNINSNKRPSVIPCKWFNVKNGTINFLNAKVFYNYQVEIGSQKKIGFAKTKDNKIMVGYILSYHKAGNNNIVDLSHAKFKDYHLIAKKIDIPNKKVIKVEKIEETNKKKLEEELLNELKQEVSDALAKRELLKSLENKYGKDCEKSFFSFFKEAYEKGSKEYEDCLIAKNEKSIADKKQIAEEQKVLETKLSKMSQMERIQYQCENVFDFYKHSKNFKDCTLQVYMAEAEAKKIELEKEVLLAKLETQKLKLETAKLKLEVSKAEEAKKQAKIEKQQAFELEKKRLSDLENQKKLLVKKEKNNAKGLGSFLDLVSVGLQIYSLTSSSPSVSSGSSGTKALQCFTSGMFQYCN